jgi:mycothiol system anti-sigma-R factor
MSCGNHHDTSCQEVLDAVFLYIDNEMTDGQIHEAITIHLKECGPCFMEFSLLRRLKQMVFRSCGESAPDTLLDAVRGRITQLRLTMAEVEIRSE